MLDRAAPRRLLHELDQPERVQLAHVVADVAERRADLVSQLAGTCGALFESAENLHPQGVRERLDDAGVRDIRSGLHALARSIAGVTERRLPTDLRQPYPVGITPRPSRASSCSR